MEDVRKERKERVRSTHKDKHDRKVSKPVVSSRVEAPAEGCLPPILLLKAAAPRRKSDNKSKLPELGVGTRPTP